MTVSGPVIKGRTPGGGRRAAAGLITAALLATTGAGCGGSPAPPTPTAPAPATPTAPAPTTPSTRTALCAAATEFRTAANQLVGLDVVAGGLDGVRAALQNLATAASNLADAAKAEFGPQADALGEAVTALRTTIDGLQDQTDLSSKLGAIATSISGVERTAAPIVDSARADCPSIPSASLSPGAPPDSGSPPR